MEYLKVCAVKRGMALLLVCTAFASACAAPTASQPSPEVQEMWESISDFAKETTCPGWDSDRGRKTADSFALILLGGQSNETRSQDELSRIIFEAFDFYC